ncbi:MFS transporter [Actinomadura fibrosa]|uniref:DHA2 family efflux MFS transporter permease subunit n=1 Tax=Actinomadura fibrosa TaxID=111802 RepID=A0ABW2XAV6_9ACTN|nr:MDR family MFS transporter [Actinomadura fibrosa]
MAVSAFMITMDNTVVANALPTIMRDLDMSNSAKDWVATGYILMFSCLMVAGGRLTDVFGCRVTFTIGMIVFTAASAVCGLAQESGVLILARVTQGAGAALALPATQVMVTVGRTDKQRSLGTIVWVGAGAVATALGPTIGGFIVQQWSWGWIFLINIVPGVLVILLGLVVLTGKGENRDAKVDLPGVLISATMLFAFTYGLEAGNKHGWADPSVISVFALAAIAFVCFVMVENWAPDPMINLRFFRNRVFAGGLLSQMLYGIGFNGMIFYSATFLQRFLGFSPPQAGLVMLPPSIAIMVMTPVAFWLAAKLGPRPAIGGGLALMAFGMFLFSTIQQGDGYAQLMPGVMIVGVGAAMGMPLVMYVLKAVPEEQAGVASGVINVIREASGAFGIAILGLLIHHVPEQGASAAELETFRKGTASGLILGAVLVLIGGLISGLTLPSRRGWLGPKHGKQAPLLAEKQKPAPATSVPAIDPAAPELPVVPAAELAMTAVHATPRDPLPIVSAADGPLAAPVEPVPDLAPDPAPDLDLTLASAAPPNEPLPLSVSQEDDDMPQKPVPTPTPGPHWWTDGEEPPKPPDDTYTWREDENPPPTPTPWPSPPSALPTSNNAWEDWPDPTTPPATPPTAQARPVPTHPAQPSDALAAPRQAPPPTTQRPTAPAEPAHSAQPAQPSDVPAAPAQLTPPAGTPAAPMHATPPAAPAQPALPSDVSAAAAQAAPPVGASPAAQPPGAAVRVPEEGWVVQVGSGALRPVPEELPTPPAGWYAPYDPDETPPGEPQADPRSDAW